jgi:hypothetical protein
MSTSMLSVTWGGMVASAMRKTTKPQWVVPGNTGAGVLTACMSYAEPWGAQNCARDSNARFGHHRGGKGGELGRVEEAALRCFSASPWRNSFPQ